MSLEKTFPKVQRQKLVDQVLERLTKIVKSEEYAAGDKLPSEYELMKLLDVGRSTLREAIRILVYAGLLEVRQGDGTYIRVSEKEVESLETKIQKAEAKELNEVIQILDVQISGLAARRRTQEDLQKIKHYLEKRNQHLNDRNYSDYLKADLAFHIAICEATYNSALIEMYNAFCNFLNQMTEFLILDVKDYYQENTLVHQNLYLAIENQDVEEARKWANINIKSRNRLTEID